MPYLDHGTNHAPGVGTEENAGSTKANHVENDECADSTVTELHTAWDVDRHIVLDSADKVVLVRFSSYCTPPDEIVFYGLRSSNKEEEPKQKRKKEEEEDDDDDDLLDALASIESKRERKRMKGKEKEKKHRHHHHGHSSSLTSRASSPLDFSACSPSRSGGRWWRR